MGRRGTRLWPNVIIPGHEPIHWLGPERVLLNRRRPAHVKRRAGVLLNRQQIAVTLGTPVTDLKHHPVAARVGGTAG